MRFHTFVVVCLLLPLSVSAAELTAETLVDLREVRAVALSPDGARAAYTFVVQRAASDPPGKPYVELWVAGDSEPRSFVGGKRVVSDPAWSADGQRLTFVLDRDPESEDDYTEIWTIPVDGGEARRLFEPTGPVRLQRPSPDGKWIAFVVKDAESEEEKKAKKAGQDWKVVDEQPRFGRLWLHDIAAGTSRRLIDAPVDVRDVVWGPKGDFLVIRATTTPRIDDDYMFSKLHRVTLDGKFEELCETAGKVGPFAVSPDGKTVALLAATTQNDPLAQSLFVVPSGGGQKARNLTADLEASLTRIAWIDAGTLLAVVAEGTRHALYRVEVKDRSRKSLTWPRLIVGALDVRGSRVALAASGPENPPELYTLDLGGAPVRRSKSNPALAGVRFARQEAIEWKGKDGLRITGVLTYPLDYKEGQRYPLVLQVHGGPEGVSLDGWTTSALYPVQLLAAKGFVVLEPNYRGSQGRGVAFSKGDHDDLGGSEFEDILAGIDHLAERGLIDPQRVGTGGWSYGGYLSAWAATRWSERFRASIVCAGLTNWIAFAGTTDIPYEMSLVHWDSWWFDETELHWSRSPLAHLATARTPTLIVHGEKDDRVHPEQSLELYTALRLRKVPTRLVLYPREPHGLDERAHQLDFAARVIEWFEKHLAGEPPPPVARELGTATFFAAKKGCCP